MRAWPKEDPTLSAEVSEVELGSGWQGTNLSLALELFKIDYSSMSTALLTKNNY